jgi:hypothetical protein
MRAARKRRVDSRQQRDEHRDAGDPQDLLGRSSDGRRVTTYTLESKISKRNSRSRKAATAPAW